MLTPASQLDFDTCDRARLARDPAFDGRFFTAVKTTRIYCRPVCPARPLSKNVTYYATAAEAERAGFRACKRCKPDQMTTVIPDGAKRRSGTHVSRR